MPAPLLIPAVILTTFATVIASQAVISGAFALVQQAIQLGALPRLEVRQTSEETAGQVYVPADQLAARRRGAHAGVSAFRSSDALANAYGIAVAGDMLVTTILVATVARGVWGWSWLIVGPVADLLPPLDLTFVTSNAHKIPDGGWFPLLVGAVALTLMLSWRRGREVALARREEDAVALDTFIAGLSGPNPPMRVPGTAIYLTTRKDILPAALSLNLKHNGVLHESLILLKISTARSPRVAEADRVTAKDLALGIRQAEMKFGFAEKPRRAGCTRRPCRRDRMRPVACVFLPRTGGHSSIAAARRPRWQEQIYAFLTRNAVRAPDYFLIPPARVVELGTKVEM